MENLFLFLATSLVLRQTTPRLKRYHLIPGCSSYLHSGNRHLHVRRTKEGDLLYFNEYAADGVTYGTVCVKMAEQYPVSQAETILEQYMKRARKPLHIAASTGSELMIETDHLTLTDYWQDAAGIDWKVKGYTNGKILALLYVKNITDTTVKDHDRFLNGFRFSFAS